MNRRGFLSTIGLSVLAAPLAVQAQHVSRIMKLGYYSPAARRNDVDEAFEQALQQLGWISGRNLSIDYGYSGGQQNAVLVVEELLAHHPDMLVVWTAAGALAAKRLTSSIPVVFLGANPIPLGLTSNLARPSANLTGISFSASWGREALGKRLQLLKEAVPTLRRVAVLSFPRKY